MRSASSRRDIEMSDAIAHRLVHGEIGAGKRAVRKFEAAVRRDELAALKVKVVGTAGRGRHGVADQEDLAARLGGERHFERQRIDMMAIGDDAAP